jgi:hypothetical protein
MRAIVSMSAAPAKQSIQYVCLASWQKAGLDVVSLNHPSELDLLGHVYDVKLERCEETSAHVFGRPLVTINAILRYVDTLGEPALVLNADLELVMCADGIAKLADSSAGGLGYLLQYNHDGDRAALKPEACGLSAFIVRPGMARLCAESFLCLGQPWWDYWLPIACLRHGMKLYTPSTPTSLHAKHASQWTSDTWSQCAMEFSRVTGMGCENTVESYSRMSASAHGAIVANTVAVAL